MVHGVVSAALLGGWSAVAGALAGGVVGASVGAAVGLALGAGYGWAIVTGRAYDLSSRRGAVAYLVDHTWSVPNTLIGALYLALNLVRGNRVDTGFTPNRNLVGLTDGVFRGYATTIGTVQAGTGVNVAEHEAVHVFQARLLGPLYLPLVIVNFMVATVLPYWLLYHDRTARPITSVATYFRCGVYPHTWHEEWAYKVQGNPPR